jgi:hypothetical protein
MEGKGSALMIALGGKPKGESSESGMKSSGSTAKKALWKAFKGDDYEAFCEALDLVMDERDDSYPAEESESDED